MRHKADNSVNKYININININIKPDTHIEIRNPSSFKKQLLIEIIDNEIPIRRIIPDSKPRNPKLADVLKVFDKWEGASRGMIYTVFKKLLAAEFLKKHDENGYFINKNFERTLSIFNKN